MEAGEVRYKGYSKGFGLKVLRRGEEDDQVVDDVFNIFSSLN